MKLSSLSRPATVLLAGTAILALGLGGTAVAKAAIDGGDVKNGSLTGSDIKNNSIHGKDIYNGSVTSNDIADNTVRTEEIRNGTIRGVDLANGSLNLEKLSVEAIAGLRNVGPYWGVILRNTQADASAILRAGPFAGPQPGVAPPRGIGSLQIQTGTGTRDKVAFGNEVEYLGEELSAIRSLGFSVYATGEDSDQTHTGVTPPAISYNNLPNITLEINPGAVVGYTSLVFNPTGSAAYKNTWHTYDAAAATTAQGGWWFTNDTLSGSVGCTQDALCTWSDVLSKVPAATIFSVGVAKGSDHEFQGAVDELRIGPMTYDFEPYGVVKH